MISFFTIIGLAFGIFLARVYRDNKEFNRELKYRQAELELLSDPEYDVEVSRVKFAREVWLYNKFGICYAKILGEGYEYDIEKEQRDRRWREMIEENRATMERIAKALNQ